MMSFRSRTLKFILLCALMGGSSLWAQVPGVPRISGGGGVQGSLGAGFTDFRVISPKQDFKLERGTYFSGSVERGFDFLNLYITLTLSHMAAEGVANYNYTNLSTSNSYSASDVAFKAKMFDLGLGLKLKLIDDYWFRPYVEGGGLGGYHEVSYTSKTDVLAGQGDDYKKKDTIMGSGTYAEAGLEIQFSDRFGVKLSGRISDYRTKKLETLNDRVLRLRSETFYFSALVGF